MPNRSTEFFPPQINYRQHASEGVLRAGLSDPSLTQNQSDARNIRPNTSASPSVSNPRGSETPSLGWHYAELQVDISRLTKERDEAQRYSAEDQKARKAMRQLLETAQAQNKADKSAKRALETRVQEADSHIVTLKNSVKQLEQERDVEIKAKDNLSQLLEEEQKKFEILEAERNLLMWRLDEQQGVQAKVSAEKDDLARQLAEKGRELENYQQKVESLRQGFGTIGQVVKNLAEY